MEKYQILFISFFFNTLSFSQLPPTVTPSIITTSKLKVVDNGIPITLGVIRYINKTDTTILDISAFQRNYKTGRDTVSIGIQPLIIKFETTVLKNNQILELIDKYKFEIIDTKFLHKKIYLKSSGYSGENANFTELPNYLIFTIKQ